MKKLSEQMSHVGQEAYEYAPEVAKLEVKLAQREQDCIDRTVEAHAAEADNEALREYAIHKKGCDVWNQTVRYFHDGEHDICDCGLAALLEASK